VCKQRSTLVEGQLAIDDLYFFDSMVNGGKFKKVSVFEWIGNRPKWLVHTVGECLCATSVCDAV